MADDAELLGLDAGLSPKKRYPFVCGAALTQLCLAGRLEYGADRVLVRRPEPTGNDAADTLLAAIGARRRRISADKCLEIAWHEVLDAVNPKGSDLAVIRKRIDAAIADWTVPADRRAFAALTVAAGFVAHPDLRGRRARGPEAAMLVIGHQEPYASPLLKAIVTAVGLRMGSAATGGASPFDVLKNMRTERLRGAASPAQPAPPVKLDKEAFDRQPRPGVGPLDVLRNLRRDRGGDPRG